MKLYSNRSLGGDKRHNVLVFLAFASEYLLLTDAGVRRVFRFLLLNGELSEHSKDEGYRPGLIFANRRPSAAAIVVDELKRSADLARADRRLAYKLVYVLLIGGVGNSNRVDAEWSKSTVEELREALFSLADHNVDLARAIVAIYPEAITRWLEKYGDVLLTGFGSFELHSNENVVLAHLNLRRRSRKTSERARSEQLSKYIDDRLDAGDSFGIDEVEVVRRTGYAAFSSRFFYRMSSVQGEKKVSPSSVRDTERFLMAATELERRGRCVGRVGLQYRDQIAKSRQRALRVREYLLGKPSPQFLEWTRGERSIFVVRQPGDVEDR